MPILPIANAYIALAITPGVIALANAIPDMGALSSLNLAKNNLGKLVLPEGWRQTGRTEWTHLDGAKVTENPGKPEGIIAIANAIPDMRALANLDIRSNCIPCEQEGGLMRICAAGGIELSI
jgi:hypothetical protein